jgi:hypothetical protein
MLIAFRWLVSFGFVAGLCGSSPALAQQDAATLVGEVSDGLGEVVPGATVTVTNIATAIEFSTQTNERGLYTLSGLRPGEYSVSIELPGFNRFVRSGVTLQVAQVARLDASLQAGSIAETVEVVGATPLPRPGARCRQRRRSPQPRG